MNFLGHAHVALWSSREPLFVLGAMLPDFASMAGVRMAPQASIAAGPVGSGVLLHHRTDAVFHGSASFVRLMQETMNLLTLANVARGTARAVSHIGIELLIDGELLEHADLRDAYGAALAAGLEIPAHVFRDPEGAKRFRVVHQRLSAHGVPDDYRNTDAVASRLARILARRPRLAMETGAESSVKGVLREIQPEVRRNVPVVLAEIARALGPAPVSSGPHSSPASRPSARGGGRLLAGPPDDARAKSSERSFAVIAVRAG